MEPMEVASYLTEMVGDPSQSTVPEEVQQSRVAAALANALIDAGCDMEEDALLKSAAERYQLVRLSADGDRFIPLLEWMFLGQDADVERQVATVARETGVPSAVVKEGAEVWMSEWLDRKWRWPPRTAGSSHQCIL